MITKTPTGGRTLINPDRPRPQGRRRDGWPSHAVFAYGPEYFPGLSGHYWCVYQFTLLNGSMWYYAYEGDYGRAFTIPEYAFPLNFAGEGFNIVVRPALVFKGDYAALSAFLLAH